MKPTLYPHQRDALEHVAEGYLAGMNRLLVKMPTGTGKTVVFAQMLEFLAGRFEIMLPDYKARKGARMLVIAHREELLEQARQKIEAANPGMMVSIEQGDRVANDYSDVIVASIQTLAARDYKRVKRLCRKHTFRLVIVDEAHHSAAITYRTVLAHLGFLPFEQEPAEGEEPLAADFDDVDVMKMALEKWDRTAPRDRLLVGVTATPNRSDAIGLECVYQTIAHNYGLKEAVEAGYLVPPRPWVVETDTSLDGVRITAGEFNQKDLAKAVNNDNRNRLALAAWNDHAYGLPTLSFTVDVAHAHEVAKLFDDSGTPSVAISGETPAADRRNALRSFMARRITMISNCMVLTEGTDLPLTQCILHLKPTKSATLYEQMTGRGLRLFENKDHCVVIDLVDIARKHSLQTAPVLYGLPPGLKMEGESLQEQEEQLEELREQYPQFDIDEVLAGGRYTLADLRARASTFDIWELPDLGAAKEMVTMSWIRSGDDYRLQYPWEDGTEFLSVQKDLLGHYDIELLLRPKGTPEAPHPAPRQRRIAAQVRTLEGALRMAEQFVAQERRSVQRITDTSAPWRQRPASSGQLGYLRSLKVPFRPGISSGEASDLINLAKQRKAAMR